MISKTTEWRRKNPEKNQAARRRQNDQRRGKRTEEGRKYRARVKASPQLLDIARKRSRDWKRKNYSRRKETRAILKSRLVKYGLTLEQYDRLLVEQENCCAVCRTTDWGSGRGPSVDHCHKTSKVRGLLCGDCNKGIGLFKDDPKILADAMAYLTKDINIAIL